MKAPNITSGDWYVGEPIRSPDTIGINTKYGDESTDGPFEETIAEVLPGSGDISKNDARFLAASKKMAEALEFVIGVGIVDQCSTQSLIRCIHEMRHISKQALLAAGYTEE